MEGAMNLFRIEWLILGFIFSVCIAIVVLGTPR